jgi:hypothetical protein
MSSECSTGLDPEGVIRQLSTRSLEHDCLEGNSHGIGAEFARYCFSKRLDDPFWIDAAARPYLIYQRIAKHECLAKVATSGTVLFRFSTSILRSVNQQSPENS